MRPTDPNKNKIYKFLGVEQADGIKTKNVVGIYKSLGAEQTDGMKTKNIFKRVKDEVVQGTTLLDNTELKNTNLIAA